MKKVVFLMFFCFLLVSLHAQNYDKANPPTNVIAVNNLIDYGIIVRWIAAENSSGYEIFCQMEGSKIVTGLLGSSYSIDMTTDTYTFGYSLNYGSLVSQYTEKKWRFGVRSKGKIDSGGRTSGPSDIVWSSYININ